MIPSLHSLRALALPLFLAAWWSGATLPAQETEEIQETEAAEVRAAPTAPPKLETIRGKEMVGWATYLASDELAGRLTGSPGQKLAATYITKHFQSLGLEPLGDPIEGGDGKDPKRGFLQSYPLTRVSLDPAKTGLIVKTGADQEAEGGTRFDRGFAVIPATREEANQVDAAGDFVYAGLVGTRRFKPGVQLEDWTGKIPVFVVDQPKPRAPLSIEQQMGMGMFLLASLKRRSDKLARLGATVVAYCVLDDDSAVTNMLTYISLAPGQDSMQKTGSMGMGQMMNMMKARVPSVFLSRKVSEAVLGAIGLKREAMGKAPAKEDAKGWKPVSGKVQFEVVTDKEAVATNVVAVLRGSDPKLRDEAIVFSAHMDHVGVRMDGDVYNGADDNASGSAGLMAIAKAFAGLDRKPRRSIIFLSVSGEELGLWGSEHFAKNPTWPLDKIVANINTDMIGRNGPESGPEDVTVTPSFKHGKFSTIVRDAATIGKTLGVAFSSGDKYYTRSDHYNFAKRGIPVVFFCNGEHEDYHQVSDHADKLSPEKMQLIARLAYWTGYRVAEADSRPEVLGSESGWLSNQ